VAHDATAGRGIPSGGVAPRSNIPQYSRSSRLASGAPRSGIYATIHWDGTLGCGILIELVNSQNKRKPSNEQVSELTTNRLSVYLRCLTQLEAAGVDTISSQSLAEQFHLNAAQIRKDLAYFGEFGVRGVGYYVKDLKRHLRKILGLDRKLRVAVMGAGNLGLALADYPGFRREGFEIVALFDVADTKIGDASRGGVPIFDIRDLKKIVRRERIDIAVIAVPAESGQPVLEQVAAAGVKAVLNFSPGTLKAPPGVKLKSVDLTVSLESLSFHLARGIDAED